MGFRFPLATLLRLREISEEREERELGKILREMAQVEQSVIDMQAQRDNLILLRERRLRSTLTSAEIQATYQEIALLETRQTETREQLSKLEVLRQHQLTRYEAAHRDREVISGLREDKLDLYRREQTRQEQNRMDDNFSSRRSLP